MPELEVLISKLVSVDTLSSCSIVVGEISSLAHESWDDTVKRAARVTKTLFPSAEGTEVLSSLGNNITIKTHIMVSILVCSSKL